MKSVDRRKGSQKATADLIAVLLDVFLSSTFKEQGSGGRVEEFALSQLLIKEAIERKDTKTAIDALNQAIRLSKKYSIYSQLKKREFIKILRGECTPQKIDELKGNGKQTSNTAKQSQI